MSWRQWSKTLYSLLRPGRRSGQSAFAHRRGQVTHVLILDGTMSSLTPGCESNAGLSYKLLSEVAGCDLSVYYEAGMQWCDWRATADVMTGRGINHQIRRAYGYLASRYRPGDRVFLLGYSRGAYAVRSLAGVIDRVGLLRAEHATERNIVTAYRYYRAGGAGAAAAAFRAAHCHAEAPIEMLGVWDTVKALGMRYALFSDWHRARHDFHNHALGPAIRHGYHALALDETRCAYTPVLWETPPGFDGRVEQVWFRGTHGDVGGQLGGFEAARPLANIALVWMLERAGALDLPLPRGWRARFACDPAAPSVGTWRGWGKIMLLRRARTIGADPSERLHETVAGRELPGRPRSRSQAGLPVPRAAGPPVPPDRPAAG